MRRPWNLRAPTKRNPGRLYSLNRGLVLGRPLDDQIMNEERDVIGEVIAEDNARPIHPAVAEYAVRALHTATSDGERVAELELLNKELWRQNEEQAREIERLTYSNNHNFECVQKLLIEKAALKAQPSGVVLPEWLKDDESIADRLKLAGWVATHDAQWSGAELLRLEILRDVARLNLSPVSAGDDMCNADNPAARCICREEFGRQVCAGGVDERAAFEAWYERKHGYSADPEFRDNQFNGYSNDRDNAAWVGWQARAALNAGSAVPDGWVMVPVEPTRAMRYSVESTRLSSAVTRQSTQHEIGEQVYRAMLAAAPSAGSQGAAVQLVECDQCPTSGGCVNVCMRAAPTAKKEG